MRPFVTVELLMIVAVVVLLTSFPLLEYGLRENPAAAIAGGVLALVGFAMPAVARVCCPMPDEKQAASERERASS